jgi:hypothetical protein
MSDTNQMIRAMVKGVYDIQKLRMQMGNRVVANFRKKMEVGPDENGSDSELEKVKLLKLVERRYYKITDGIADISRRRKLDYDGIISDYSELCLVQLYITSVEQEKQHMKKLSQMVEEHPLWDAFLKDTKGVGGAMAGVIISEFDIHKAKYVSSMWKYAGLDVVNGEGRSRRKEHLEDYEYVDSEGEVKEKKGITFNPFLKSKLIGVLGSSFLRSRGKYKDVYDDYKNRLENSPAHVDKTPGHRHNMAIRYMVKMFIKDLYVAWKEVEGLEALPSYQEAKLNHKHAS